MEYTLLGRTGVRVSRLALGTATFGVAPREKDAINLVHKALDSGINPAPVRASVSVPGLVSVNPALASSLNPAFCQAVHSASVNLESVNSGSVNSGPVNSVNP